MDQQMTVEEWERQKDFYRGVSTDMSPAAVAKRIEIANGLNKVIRQLSAAGRIEPGPPGETPEQLVERINLKLKDPTPLNAFVKTGEP